MTTAELIARAEENAKWVGHNYERLVDKYNDKWVAVLDLRVIDSDKDLRTLVSRLMNALAARYPEAAIEYVSKKPINMVLVF